LAEPQGIAYIPSSNRVFVANGKDGSVRAFDAATWKMLKSIPYGEDADNLRVDPSSGHIWVGYGGGALSELDQEGTKLADIKLDAHPESFQLEKNGSRIFVNLPGSRKIAVVDRKTGSVHAIKPLESTSLKKYQNRIRNHMVGEHPQLLYVRFWDQGRAIDIVTALRYALNVQVGIAAAPCLVREF
jgi:hypothetical protein